MLFKNGLKNLLLVGWLSLAACSLGGGGSSPVSPTPPAPTGYTAQYENWGIWTGWSGACFPGVNADGSFNFQSNVACSVSYTEKTTLARPTSVQFTAGNATYYPFDLGSPGCDETVKVRMLLMTDVANLANRYWQNTGVPITPGTHTIPISYDPSQWHDVNGESATQSLTFFNQALNQGVLGYSFGTDCRNGHGVYTSVETSWSQNGL